MDLRQHFALERTLLAYVRTGLALVGMGFVVARFGMLVRELGLRSGPAYTPGLSLWFETGLVLLGGLIGPVAWSAYLKHLSRQLCLSSSAIWIGSADHSRHRSHPAGAARRRLSLAGTARSASRARRLRRGVANPCARAPFWHRRRDDGGLGGMTHPAGELRVGFLLRRLSGLLLFVFF
jgi:uncharacterized membrane protein YidH (DUF202 family)